MTRPLQSGWRKHLRAPLLASLILHGALALVLLRAPLPQPPDEPLAIELVEVPPVLDQAPSAPLDEPAAPTEAPEVEPTRSRPRSERPPHAEATPPPRPTAPAPAAPGPSWMQMRSPAQALARGAGPVVELGPGAPAASDALALADRPPPNVIHHPIGNAPHTPGHHRAESGVTAKVGGDGAVTFKDPDAIEDVQGGVTGIGLGLSGRFDLNDTVARAIGEDPYAYAKKKFAEATFEDRLCLAEKAAVTRKQQALLQLKDHLESLRRRPGLSQAQRRELVFEMWDECVEETKDGPDLGAAARATILAFIRRAFPPGGPEAYVVNELATLNRRRVSRPLFDPYGTLAPPPDAGAP